MGIEEAAIRRLLRAMETAAEPERHGILRGISTSLSHAIERLEAPVKTAVIPAAGGQHRLLASHVIQELLLRSIGEAFESGISNVILILAPGMLDSVYTPLRKAFDLLPGHSGQIQHAVQPEPRGLGDAILHAEDLAGQQPFAVVLPDDVVGEQVRASTEPWVLRRMMNVFGDMDKGHLLAVMPVPKSMLPRYGVVQVAPGPLIPGVFTVSRLVEKPELGHAICRSRRTFGVVGRYILQPSIFQPLRELKEEGRTPLHLTDALESLRQDNHKLMALQLKVARKDVGQALSRASELIAAATRGSRDPQGN
jgi:UTP--glucose-1-phosphate uridylyltransferase